jgi:hypothetical protein
MAPNPLREPTREALFVKVGNFDDFNLSEEDLDAMDGDNKFAVPDAPDNMSYQWRRYAVKGAPDHDHYTHLLQRGWRPVPTSRHPSLMPPGTPKDDAILKSGMILMEIPIDRQRARDAKSNSEAVNQVRAKEAQLSNAPNVNGSDTLPRTKPQLGKEYIAHKIEDE